MPEPNTTLLIEREDVERARLAVRAAIAAASALINDKTAIVPVDHAVALQLWFGLTSELIEVFGEATVRHQLEVLLGIVAKNQGVIDAFEDGATAGIIVHPDGCPCAMCVPP